MKYYSTNHRSPQVSLREAVTRGLAPDGGLYMPERLPVIPRAFFNNLPDMTLPEIAYVVANMLFGGDIDSQKLKDIVFDTLNFEIPLRKVDDNIYSLELFHGPTLAFKDVGAKFMARMLSYFVARDTSDNRPLNVLVATSGDTGSAVANGFFDVPGINVYALYPSGKVSPIQEAQFATLGHNITAIEVNGTFDDCQRMVKEAFVDPDLSAQLRLTSANSINPARFLPQMFYYFWAYAQLLKQGGRQKADNMVMCVPSGNLGNICAGLMGNRMGLPVKRFVAANNANDVFTEYLATGEYRPRRSVATVANAMDVGDPSNFARILATFADDHKAIASTIEGYAFSDDEIIATIADTYSRTGYMLDPHGATGYAALKRSLKPGETGIFLETAHPAKFSETVEKAIGQIPEIPEALARHLQSAKRSVRMAPSTAALKRLLLDNNQNLIYKHP